MNHLPSGDTAIENAITAIETRIAAIRKQGRQFAQALLPGIGPALASKTPTEQSLFMEETIAVLLEYHADNFSASDAETIARKSLGRISSHNKKATRRKQK